MILERLMQKKQTVLKRYDAEAEHNYDLLYHRESVNEKYDTNTRAK